MKNITCIIIIPFLLSGLELDEWSLPHENRFVSHQIEFTDMVGFESLIPFRERTYPHNQYRPDAGLSTANSQISACEHFTSELAQVFEENRADIEVVGYILDRLKSLGCLESDADLRMIQARYDELYAAHESGKNQHLGSKEEVSQLVEKGDFEGAVRLLKTAAHMEQEEVKKAQHYYQIATIQAGELGQIDAARGNALRAARLDSSSGKHFILLGDIYARMVGTCGEGWQQRLVVLAAIEKYEYARRIDQSVAEVAARRVSNLSGALPLREEGLLRKVLQGEKILAECVNETVTVRFK